ncbi:MAG: RDD family protein [Gammaproteobacteria bacterium]
MSAAPHTPYIGPGRRLAALLVDLLLAGFLLSVIAWLLRLHYPDSDALTAQARQTLALLAAPVTLLAWWLFQGTPGKLLLGCHIVDARDGGRPRAWQVLVRLLGYAVAVAPAGLGLLWMFRDRRRQGWHDKLARTLVVADDEAAKSLRQLSAELR